MWSQTLCLILYLNFVLCLSLDLWDIREPFNRRQISDRTASDPLLPLISLWSDVYTLSVELDVLIKCPSPFGDASVDCLTSRNQSKHKDSRTAAMMMYGPDIDLQRLPLPRRKDHLWAVLHDESPKGQPMLMLDKFLRLFNFSSTMNRVSDFPLTSMSIYNVDYLASRQPVSLDRKNRLVHKRRTKPVLYVQSLCLTFSDRDTYIRELMKYVDIDAYGACLNNRKMPDKLRDAEKHHESKAFHEFAARFKFHIAFENAVCSDYMSEKLFRALHVGSIPIYFGSKKNLVQKWLPSANSVIFVTDFESPKHLGDYINYLNKNNTAYMEYLRFKNHFENQELKIHLQNRPWDSIQTNNEDYKLQKATYFPHFMCFVCKEIHKRKRPGYSKSEKMTMGKIVDASHFNCSQPKPILGSLASVTDEAQRKYIQESRNEIRRLHKVVDELYTRL